MTVLSRIILIPVLILYSGSNSLNAQSLEPEVHWRQIEWPMSDSETGFPVTQEGSGEDWWYDHKNTYDINGIHDGYIAVGFQYGVNRILDYDVRDLDGDGTYEGCYYCNAITSDKVAEYLETDQIKRRCGRAIMMKYDLHGRCKWARNYNAGEFMSVIQTSDGGYLALGYTHTTVNAPINIQDNYSPNAPSHIGPNDYLYYNPESGQPLNHFDCQNTSPTTGVPLAYDNRGKRPFLVKTDANGLIEWNYQYGGQDFLASNGENAAFSQKLSWGDIVETDDGDFLLVYSTHDDVITISNNENEHDLSYLISIDQNGYVNWKTQLYDHSVLIESIAQHPTNPNKFAVSGLKNYPSYVQGNVLAFNKTAVVGHFTVGTSGITHDWTINGKSYREAGVMIQNPTSPKKRAKSTDVDYKNNGEVVFPYLDNCVPCFGAGHNEGVGKVLVLNSSNGGINAMLDIGPVNAFDFKMAATPTSDGGFAVLSSKGNYDAQGNPIYSQHQDLDIGPNLTAPLADMTQNAQGSQQLNNWIRYWDTDAYFVKFNSSNQQEWDKKVDSHDNPRVAYPGDLKKQECVYSLSESPDGGLITSGNTSHNFDDFYLLKLFGDCQKEVSGYETPTNSTDNTIEINSNTTWNSSKKINSRVVIDNGATLTIDGATIEFADFRQTGELVRIDVMPGAKLLLKNGAKLTSIQSCPFSVWNGIAVYGNSSLAQSFPNQGAVVIEGASSQQVVIENAIDAIMTKGFLSNNLKAIDWTSFGGIIQAEYARFENNLRDVEFMRYSSYEGGIHQPNISYFNHCEFVKSDEFAAARNYRGGSVTMWDVQGVEFTACTFDNTALSLQEQNTTCGIYTIDANYTVTWDCQNPNPNAGCSNADSSYFWGMKYGVRSEYTKGFATNYIDIHGTEFKTFNGVYFGGAYGNSVTRSSFYVTRLDEFEYGFIPYGLYLDYNTGFTTEENKFYSRGLLQNHNVGFVANNSGSLHNEIYNNSFKSFHVGLSAQGNNNNGLSDPLQNLYNDGLELRCNDFEFGRYDIFVQGDPTVAWDGIKLEQGQPGANSTLAGNTFSLFGSTNSDYLSFPNSITYHHHKVGYLGNPTNLKPVDILNVNNVGHLFWYSKSASCPVDIAMGKTNGDLHDEITAAQNAISTDHALLTQLMNSSNDWQLEADILFANTQQEWLDIYTDLMNQSPYLGHEVIETAILETDFPDLMLRNVMLANPDAPKSEYLMNLIYARNMPSWIVQDILDGRSSYGAKEVLIGRISSNEGVQHDAIAELIRVYNRATTYDGRDSTIALLSTRDELAYRYLLIEAYLANGDYSSATNELSAIYAEDHSGKDSLDLSAYYSWYTLLIQNTENQETWFDIDASQMATINTLADTSNHNAPMLWASQVLNLIDEKSDYAEPVYMPQSASYKTDGTSARNESMEEEIESLKVYPNPAEDVLNVVVTDAIEGIAEIYAMDGTFIMSKDLSYGSAIIDVSGLAPGVYMVKTTNEAGEINVVQIVVNR
jgi:hypothetical protein